MKAAVGNAPAAPPAASNETARPSDRNGVAPGDPSLPLSPSQGAINSALGQARREAQACIEEDAGISHASVRFNSTGAVESVTVSGWAAGRPAEACVRAALLKPRVEPFLQPTYVVTVTIRSN
jgi:hypothetical protein